MRELVFLLEEPSAAAMLAAIVQKLLPAGVVPRFIPFEGKQDLERQLIRRIRGYRRPHASFIVMRDQDAAPDCRDVKARLKELCDQAGHPEALIRIACRELETFYLADLDAVEKGLGLTGLAKHQHVAKFRNPDRLGSPSNELKRLTNGLYQKVAGSRAIGPHLDLNNTRSPSFRNLVTGIRRIAEIDS